MRGTEVTHGGHWQALAFAATGDLQGAQGAYRHALRLLGPATTSRLSPTGLTAGPDGGASGGGADQLNLAASVRLNLGNALLDQGRLSHALFHYGARSVALCIVRVWLCFRTFTGLRILRSCVFVCVRVGGGEGSFLCLPCLRPFDRTRRQGG